VTTSVGTTFLIVFREALEAGLIIGIILTVLARLDALRYARHVGVSVLLAGLASLGLAAALAAAGEGARGRYEKLFEGAVSIVACGVVTYMVFWMHNQARRIKTQFQAAFEKAIPQNDLFVMISLPFIAVFREGAETVLFLKAVSLQSGEAVSLWGGLAGFGLAIAVTLAIFVGGRKVPLKPLFQGTGYFLILIAAGLLAYGVHELEEAKVIHGIIYPVWNINHILNEKTGLGSFLKALFGYNGNPSLLEVALYWLYLSAVLFFLHRPSATGAGPSATNGPLQKPSLA
jgi:high-affinity iron transporter